MLPGIRARARTRPPRRAIDAEDADLGDLATFVGRNVRVGGLVVDLRADGFTLDDGTATGRVILRAAALDSLALIEPDDALNVIGRVETGPDGPVVVVDDPGRLFLAGDPVPDASPIRSRRSGAVAGASAGPSGAGGSGRFGGSRRWRPAGRCGHGRARRAGRDLGRLGRRDPAPPGAVAPPAREPDRRPAGHARRPYRRPR